MVDPPSVPQPEFRDRFRQVVTAFADVHPASAITMNVFDLLVAPSLQKRREAFFAQLGVDIATLSRHVADLEDRMADREDEFASLALRASFAAVQTTDEAKLERLRNAALNGVMTDIDANLGEMFIQAVSDLTPLHIEVLTYLSDPEAALKARGLDPEVDERASVAFRAMFPDAGHRPREVGGTVLRELYARGFTVGHDLGRGSGRGNTRVSKPWTTDLGLTFLAFIDPPWST